MVEKERAHMSLNQGFTWVTQHLAASAVCVREEAVDAVHKDPIGCMIEELAQTLFAAQGFFARVALHSLPGIMVTNCLGVKSVLAQNM